MTRGAIDTNQHHEPRRWRMGRGRERLVEQPQRRDIERVARCMVERAHDQAIVLVRDVVQSTRSHGSLQRCQRLQTRKQRSQHSQCMDSVRVAASRRANERKNGASSTFLRISSLLTEVCRYQYPCISRVMFALMNMTVSTSSSMMMMTQGNRSIYANKIDRCCHRYAGWHWILTLMNRT